MGEQEKEPAWIYLFLPLQERVPATISQIKKYNKASFWGDGLGFILASSIPLSHLFLALHDLSLSDNSHSCLPVKKSTAGSQDVEKDENSLRGEVFMQSTVPQHPFAVPLPPLVLGFGSLQAIAIA